MPTSCLASISPSLFHPSRHFIVIDSKTLPAIGVNKIALTSFSIDTSGLILAAVLHWSFSIPYGAHFLLVTSLK